MSLATRSGRAAARLLPCGWLVLLVVMTSGVSAHEVRPAYLQIDQVGQGRFSVLWRTPLLSGMRLPVLMKLSDDIGTVTEPSERYLSDSVVERSMLETAAGLAGQRIDFVGLQATITDVLVRVRWLDGSEATTIVRPARPWIVLSGPRTAWEVARTYLVLGIEHILMGLDHLLFVVGLMLIVGSIPALVKTITAFTVAHSITLGLATLGYASIPAAPLNAAIALSILFLGMEIARTWRGQTSLTIRYPWIVALGFGLLHGFGFASGLTAIGLPSGDIPLALLAFNVGVEIGQLAFVLIILLLYQACRILQFSPAKWVHYVPGYAVGSLGAFWTIERSAMLF